MGKTAIAQELKRRGHIVYDPEKMRGFMHNQSRLTGESIAVPADIPAGWYDTIGAYNWDPVRIIELLDSPDDVFICSKAHNQAEFYDKFQLIFVLTLDFTELIERLRSRPGKTIGKTESELSDILALHEHFEQGLLNRGAVNINVSQAIPEIVEEILARVSIYRKTSSL